MRVRQIWLYLYQFTGSFNHQSVMQRKSFFTCMRAGKTVSLSQFLDRVQQPVSIVNLELRNWSMGLGHGREKGSRWNAFRSSLLARLLAWQGMYALLGLNEEGGRPGSLVAHHATRELPTQVEARENTKPRLKLKRGCGKANSMSSWWPRSKRLIQSKKHVKRHKYWKEDKIACGQGYF